MSIFSIQCVHITSRREKNQTRQILVFEANLIWPLANFSHTSMPFVPSFTLTKTQNCA